MNCGPYTERERERKRETRLWGDEASRRSLQFFWYMDKLSNNLSISVTYTEKRIQCSQLWKVPNVCVSVS
jgi:hypothetical protein